MGSYGKELIIDLHDADLSKFTREFLSDFLDELCFDVLDVRPEDRHFWDDQDVEPEKQQTDPRTKGTTVVQFLLFSNITIHTLDLLKRVYINIFVCKEFDMAGAVALSRERFNAKIVNVSIIERK